LYTITPVEWRNKLLAGIPTRPAGAKRRSLAIKIPWLCSLRNTTFSAYLQALQRLAQKQLILDKSELVLLFFSQHALEGGIVAHITKQRLSPVRTIEHVIHGIACCDLAMLVP